jgi:hypothetical protein
VVLMIVRILAAIWALVVLGPNPYNGAFGHYGGTAKITPAGAPLDGFAVALSADSSIVAFGQPTWVTVEVRNVSDTLQHTYVGSRNGGFDFRIIEQRSGKAVPRNEQSTFGLDSVGGPFLGMPVPANHSVFLKFDLQSLYEFGERGNYTVQVSAAHIAVNGHRVTMPPSNQITVQLR